MKEKRRYIRFKSDETTIVYFSHANKQFPALLVDESRNSMACVLAGEYDFANGDQLTWIESEAIKTPVEVIKMNRVDNGVHKLVVKLVPQIQSYLRTCGELKNSEEETANIQSDSGFVDIDQNSEDVSR